MIDRIDYLYLRVLAQTPTSLKLGRPEDIGFSGPGAGGTGVVRNILLQVYFWAGIIAVAVIVWAGYLYVTSTADASKVTQAKNAIIGAVVGLIVIMSAYLITTFVIGLTR